MPIVNFLLTLRERFTTLPRSKLTSDTLTPNSPALPTMWKTSAERSSALVGMHPQLRQIPPRCSRSTTATFRPSWLPRMAAG